MKKNELDLTSQKQTNDIFRKCTIPTDSQNVEQMLAAVVWHNKLIEVRFCATV